MWLLTKKKQTPSALTAEEADRSRCAASGLVEGRGIAQVTRTASRAHRQGT